MENNLKLKRLADWGMFTKTPVIISGPCSAETEHQTMETARQVAKQNVQVIRAGIWKPRTRPNMFEGVGTIGLEWLRAAKAETGLPVTVEVANVKHVYEALKFGVDILWIGARTTVNPFSVQEIADALVGVNVPVLVKNPINPDLDLWIGAIERIHQAGIDRIGAVHRGFSSFKKTKYRNPPSWEIPIELKRRIPEIPLFCDPSHICGDRKLLRPIAQKAMDLEFDGLMIESHINPDKAWSDAKQQITPEDLGKLLSQLVFRHVALRDAESELAELRRQIDHFDNQVIEVLAGRMNVVREIARVKKDNNITILQTKRWDDIIKTRLKKGADLKLTEDFVKDLLGLIHREAIHIQTHVLNADLGADLPGAKED